MGEQYRSIIFVGDDNEKQEAQAKIQEIQESLKDGSRVVTEVLPFEKFYPAEGYHQKYFELNKSAPYCQLIIEPKIEKLKNALRSW